MSKIYNMSKITEQFVPYKQAKELKELGFKEHCLGYYEDSELQISQVEYIELDDNFYVLAPLYQQTFDWFREKYQLFSSIKPSFCNNSSSIIFLYYYINNNEDFTCIVEYKTYQEAQLACLDKLISLVKEEKK